VIHNSDQEKLKALHQHSLLSFPNPRVIIAKSPTPYLRASQEGMGIALQALARTANNSSPGPNGFSYRLLNAIKGTPVFNHIINDIAVCGSSGALPPPAGYTSS